LLLLVSGANRAQDGDGEARAGLGQSSFAGGGGICAVKTQFEVQSQSAARGIL